VVAAPLTRVLVTDAEQRASVAVVRSLGRAGLTVIVGVHAEPALAAVSRYASKSVRLPDPLVSARCFAEAIERLVLDEKIDAILPISEQSLLALLGERHRFPTAILPFPALATFQRICDKQEVLKIAQTVGIEVPKQCVISHFDELSAEAQSLNFPLVLKPSRSVGTTGEQLEKQGVTYAHSLQDLRRQVASMSAAGFPLLLQERIEGYGTGIFLLRWEGRTHATFAHQRLREKPPSGGVSTYAESILPDPELLAASERLLDKLGWSGVAMVEYKRDESCGRDVLMEINGRFWGSLQLAIDAGVDFPILLLQVASGRGITASPPRLGVRYRWLMGDVDSFLKVIFTRRAHLNVPGSFPTRMKLAKSFFRFGKNERWDLYDSDDSRPFTLELRRWIVTLASAILRVSRRLLRL